MDTIIFRQRFDAHTHQREGLLMEMVLPYMLKVFPDFQAMPNLEREPLIFGSQAVAYGNVLKAHAEKLGLPCRPVVSIKYDPKLTTPDVVYDARRQGIKAIKFYPDGVTSNSEGGVRDLYGTYPILEAAQECGMIVQWHGEHPDSEIMQREIDFLIFFEDAVHQFPQLKQTLEHLSTWQSVQLIRKLANPNIGATITAHHLFWTLTDMAGGKFKVHLMCKPILKNKKDRQALQEAATGDEPYFFYGSDSAPWIVSYKHTSDVCSGVFTAPYGLPMVAEVFEMTNKLENLEQFVSIRGRTFYGLPIPEETTTLVRESWKGPEYFGEGELSVMNAAKDITFNWKVL